MEYLYRAITRNDLNKFENKQDILAPEHRVILDYYPDFENYLSEIITHIISGNTETMWIS